MAFNRRPELEFSRATKIQALKNAEFSCEVCGVYKTDTEEQYLEIHHILPLYIAEKYFPQVTDGMLTSILNASVLCCHHHDQIHQYEDLYSHGKQAELLMSLEKINLRKPRRARV